MEKNKENCLRIIFDLELYLRHCLKEDVEDVKQKFIPNGLF